MWIVSQAYHIPPGEAWRALGYGDLTRRQSHRLTVAATELGNLSAAYDDVKRQTGDYTPAVESTLAVAEATRLFEAAWQPEWTRMAEYVNERFPDEPVDTPAPDGVAVGAGPSVTGDVYAVE